MRNIPSIKEKADAIKLSGKVEGVEIMQLEEQIAKLECQKKELKEAIMAGNLILEKFWIFW